MLYAFVEFFNALFSKPVGSKEEKRKEITANDLNSSDRNWEDEVVKKEKPEPLPQFDYNKDDPVFFVVRNEYTNNEVLGDIVFLSGLTLKSIENPWVDNKQRQSCIPTGEYKCGKRFSGIVQRTTARRAKKYRQGWEIKDVPTRTYIMFHIANRASDLLGCVAPGLNEGVIGNERAVLSSGDAFDIFMDEMENFDEWTVHVIDREDFAMLDLPI